MSRYSNVVAIDGPCGSGKSEMAKEVATKLGLVYIDTGAMYRTIGLLADRAEVPFEEGKRLTNFLNQLKINYGVSDDVLIEVDKEDLTCKIREHHVSGLASKISKIITVRDYLLDFQRDLGNRRSCVMEGRDIGTVIFPNAFCKVFLTASIEVRASRRLMQLKEMGEEDILLEKVLKDLKERDERDSKREIAPLKQADDAVLLDSSSLNREEVLNQICEIAKSKAKELGVDL